MDILNYKVLMQRTLKNLDYIIKNDPNEPGLDGKPRAQTDEPPYAVTQRVNSYLGAFAPVYDETLIKEYVQQGSRHVFHPARAVPSDWPSFGPSPKAPNKDAKAPNAGEYCRRVRNALAHGQIKFEAEERVGGGGKEITAVHLWTRAGSGKGNPDWGGKLPLADFEKFLRAFCEFIEATFDDEGKAKPAR